MWIDCEKNSNVTWYCESQCELNSFHIKFWEDCEEIVSGDEYPF